MRGVFDYSSDWCNWGELFMWFKFVNFECGFFEIYWGVWERFGVVFGEDCCIVCFSWCGVGWCLNVMNGVILLF